MLKTEDLWCSPKNLENGSLVAEINRPLPLLNRKSHLPRTLEKRLPALQILQPQTEVLLVDCP